MTETKLVHIFEEWPSNGLSLWDWENPEDNVAIKVMDIICQKDGASYQDDYRTIETSHDGFIALPTSLYSDEVNFKFFHSDKASNQLEVGISINPQKTTIHMVRENDAGTKFRNGELSFLESKDAFISTAMDMGEEVEGATRRIKLDTINDELRKTQHNAGLLAIEYLVNKNKKQPTKIAMPEIAATTKLDALENIIISQPESDTLSSKGMYAKDFLKDSKNKYNNNPNPRAFLNAVFLQNEIKKRYGVDLNIKFYKNTKLQPKNNEEKLTSVDVTKEKIISNIQALPEYLSSAQKLAGIYQVAAKYVDIDPFHKIYIDYACKEFDISQDLFEQRDQIRKI